MLGYEPATARLTALAGELAARFAVGAAMRDRLRVLPRDEIGQLAESGLLAVTVPRELGGPGWGGGAVAELLRLLATADPNIAQVPQSHFVYLAALWRNGSAEQRRFFAGEVLGGRVIANAQAEARTSDAGQLRTRLRTTRTGLVLQGEKHYATGSLFADWIGVLALDDDGRQVIAYVPARAPGVTVLDDWEGMGQRTTASGTVRLDDVAVAPQLVLPHHRTYETPSVHGAFAQLLHAAIDAGIARGALRDTGEFLRTLARPWRDADVEDATQDPLTLQRFGDLEISVRAAEALLTEAGRAIDAVGRTPTPQSAAAVSIAVAAARTVAGGAAVEVADALFELGGTRATRDELNLHRHWRNARTHTLHDPLRWKVQHVGRYALNGTPPPRHGMI